jgi:hypothetical protein
MLKLKIRVRLQHHCEGSIFSKLLFVGVQAEFPLRDWTHADVCTSMIFSALERDKSVLMQCSRKRCSTWSAKISWSFLSKRVGTLQFQRITLESRIFEPTARLFCYVMNFFRKVPVQTRHPPWKHSQSCVCLAKLKYILVYRTHYRV